MNVRKPYLRNRSNRTKSPASLAAAMACLGCLFPLLAAAANPAQDDTPRLNVWSRLGPDRATNATAINPANPNIIYAGSGTGLFKSSDGGASWSKKDLSNIQALAIDFVNTNTLYLAGPSAFLKSTDGGETWSNVNSPVKFDISLLRILRTSPQTLYCVVSSARSLAGVHKSTDGGASWKGVSKNDINLYNSYGWAINPADSQTIYAGGFGFNGMDFGLYKSTDGGGSWGVTGLPGYPVTRVVIDPTNPNTIYSTVDEYDGFSGLSKSTDGGGSWVGNNGLVDVSDTGQDVEEIIIDPDDSQILFVAFSERGIFWSVDGGASWSEFNVGLASLGIRDLALDAASNRLYAATPAGLFVNQYVTPCTSPLSSTSQSFDSSGGTGQIALEAGSDCNWTATSIASWITITSDGSGAGDGTVSYSVAPNESTASRRGIIDIGVRPFAVSQAGLPVRINGATVSGRNLLVSGENFDEGAIIWLNGEAKITKNDPQNPKTSLIGKKAGKKIKPGDKLQVRNSDGALSEEFTFQAPGPKAL